MKKTIKMLWRLWKATPWSVSYRSVVKIYGQYKFDDFSILCRRSCSGGLFYTLYFVVGDNNYEFFLWQR